MAFASIHIPDFLVQAILRARPELFSPGPQSAKGGAALAVIDGKPPQQAVIAASRAALQKGIQPGMAKSQAEEFSSVMVVQRAPAQEAAAHSALLDLGWSFSPRVEDTAPDTITLDLDGLASLFGAEEQIAQGLMNGASSMGLAAQVAIASNMETAFHIARGCRGITVIPRGEEAARMSSLPVRILSPSAEILEILESWGVRTCGQLAALPVLPLSERLGQAGVRLRDWARGAGSRALVSAEPRSGFTEEMELDDAVEELEPLSFVLGRLLDQLCARLAGRCLSAAAIHLHLELQSPVRQEEAFVYEKTMVLPVPMRNSKLLLNLIRLQLQANPPQAPIAKVVLSAEAARPRAAQDGLFVPSYPEPEKLELTMARLANLVGEANVGAPELVDTHRPGAFHMSRFSLIHREPAAIASVMEQEAEERGVPKAVLRVFRPPVPMKTELGLPGSLAGNRPRRVFFHGRSGEVAMASGPWRTSGEWWAENWQWDEWDVEIHFHSAPAGNSGITRGIYRIYFDRLCQSWFVRGVYD